MNYQVLFETLFEQNSLGTVLSSAQGNILRANRAFLQLLAINPLAQETDILTFIHPDDHVIYHHGILQAADQTTPNSFLSLRLIHSNQEQLLVRVKVNYFQYQQEKDALLFTFEHVALSIDLMKGEELFRHLYEESPIAIVLKTTKDRGFAQANKKYCELVGYSLAELQQLKIDEITHPEDIGIHLERYQQLMKGLIPSFTYEKRYIKKDGEIIWVHVSLSTLHNAKGEISQSIAMVQDITTQRHAQETIYESEQRFRTFFDHSPLAIAIRDYETEELTSVNEKFCELFGYTREEVIGKSRFIVSHWEDKVRYERLLDQLVKGEIPSFSTEKAYRKKDGTIIWCESTRGILFIKDRIYISATMQDITEKRKIELKTQSMTQVLKNLISFLPIVYYRIDEEGIFTESIGSGLVKLGYKEQEVVGQNVFELYQDNEDIVNTHHIALAGGYKSYETSVPGIDGIVYYNTYIFFDQANGKGAIGLAFDITPAKKTLFALQESEERYRTIFDASEEGMVLVDVEERKILECNQAILQMLEANREEVMKATPLDFSPEFQPNGQPSRQKYMSVLKEAAVKQEPISFEWQQLTKNKRVFDSEITACPIVKETHKLWLFIIRDVTEKKKIETEKLRLYKEQEYIFDAMPLQFYFKDTKNNVIRCNKRAAELLQMPVEQVQNVNASVYAAEFAEQYWQDDLEVIRTKQPKLNIIEKTKTANDFIWVSTDKVPHFNEHGEVVGVLVFTKNVTDLYEAQQALKISEAKYRDIFESVNDCIIMMDTYANVIEGNQAAKQLFELSEWRIINFKELIHPDDQIDFQQYFELLKKEGKYTGHQTRIITDHDNIKYIEINSTAIRDENGNFVGSKDIVRDITDRMLVQQELEENNQSLKKINTELDHFVYRASHDLRAPLSSLLGLIEVIKMQESAPVTLDLLDKMGGQINKLENFIKEIIDYSRVSRTGLSTEELSIEQLIVDTFEDFRFMEHANLINLEIRTSSHALLTTDKRSLEIVLNNLLSNAIKYADFAKSPYVLVHIDQDTESRVMSLRIEDNGIGIKEEFQPQIFDMFFRATDKNIGSGLGLFIVKEAIQKIEGTIEVSSTYGKGSTFHLVLPQLIND